MDRQEAKEVLQALRPSDLATDKPFVIEALTYVEADAGLKAWWQAQQAFDQKVTAKLAEVPVPADLRDKILYGHKIVKFTPAPHLSYWLAAAAVVAILCATITSLQVAAHGPLPRAEYTATVLPLLNHDAPPLAMISPDHDKIMAWLKESNAPMGKLPAKMTSLPTIGCQKFVVQGHKISLICFALAGGGIAHLLIIDEEALSDPPGNDTPEFDETEGWHTASWSDGRMSYMLATQAGPDALRQLL